MSIAGKKLNQPASNSSSDKQEAAAAELLEHLIEVVDEHDKPVGYMPLEDVRRQALYHRQVIVLVYNEKNKIFLQKKEALKKRGKSLWDVSTSAPICAEQSAEETALAALSQELGITLQGLRPIGQALAGPSTGNAFISVFSTGMVPLEHIHSHPVVKNGFFFDHEEISSLVKHYREMLSPSLLLLWDMGVVFPASSF